MAAPGRPRPGNAPPSYNPNYNPNLADNMQNLQIGRMPNSGGQQPRPPPPFGQQPAPFPSSAPPSSPFQGSSPFASRPGPPPPPGALPRASVPPGGTPQATLPSNAAPARPTGSPNFVTQPRPPFGSRPPPPGYVPPPAGQVAPPVGSRPGPFQSSPLTTGSVVPPSRATQGSFSNGPSAFVSGPVRGGPRFPAAGSTPRPSAGQLPPPMLSPAEAPPRAPSMHSFMGSPPASSPTGPPQHSVPFLAPPSSLPFSGPPQPASPFSAPPQGIPPPPSGFSPFSGPPRPSQPFSAAPPQGIPPPPSGSSPFPGPPQGVPPPPGSPFGPQTWPPQQMVPPPSIPGSAQTPRMYGMPPQPPLPDQSMAAMAGPSRIDPNQIPRPIPNSSVILHETRQSNQANPPPPATSEYVVSDTGNCSPRYLRCTINQIPCTSDLLNTSGMQLALLVQPLALPHPSEEPIQVVDFGESGPVRCSRCKGYINPFMKFIDQGRRFICNLCGFTDETPREYHCNLAPDGRRRDADERPELCRGTVEFVATKEYLVRDPMPAVFFFLIDVSMNAIQTGATAAACSAINQVIADLPEGPRTMVGVATFDSTIHFYNLKRALQQPLMLIVPDVQDVYTPLQTDIIVQLSECRQHLELLLENIPTMFQNSRTADSAFGAAIKAAFLAMKSSGGKLLVFQSVLPSIGICALSAREAEGRANVSAAEKEAHKLLQPADKNLKTMAIEFAEYQVCVDVFITTQTYVDITSISVIPRTTGGQVYYYHPFSALSDPAKLYNDLRWNVIRPQGFEAVMRGLQVQEYSGNFCKRIPTDVDLPAIDCDKTVLVTLKHDDKLQDGSECAFQCALLYTTVYGERRIRVSTLSLPCTTMLTNLFRSADLDTQFACFLKQAASEIPSSPLLQIREQLTNHCINILHSYRKFCATVSSSGQLILPEALKLLPLYTLASEMKSFKLLV
ncbi:hypothetical protein RJ639_003664 [Escallonia herrerae]|uniref:Uncharacterized protein n=1 Tax=Escallonia herrerae TaxID=1293975 RepID=A0AA89AWR0_9ASTE|nr:hypothetical protein RJ639_003664 [Escallonia herrerae]